MAASHSLVAELGVLVIGGGGGEARDEAECRTLLVSPESTLAAIGPNVEAIRLGECVIVERTDEMIRMET